MTYRLGRQPNDPRKPRLRWNEYQVAAPTPPPSADWVSQVKSWPMSLNDSIGDCTAAGAGHIAQLVNWYGRGQDAPVSDADVLAMYEAISGYNPADPSTDVGATLQDALNYWRKSGVGGNTITAFAQLDPQNLDLVRDCISLFGAVYCGLNVPQSAMDQIHAGQPWTLVAGSPILGGHCLAPGTRVLRDDLRWVPIEEVNVGEGLIGFDEQPTGGNRRFARSLVESSDILELPCFELEFDDGTTVIASEDHLWLSATSGGGRTYNQGWIRTDQMRVRGPGGSYGTKIRKALPVWDEDRSRNAGYLAAAFDGEGWIDSGKVARSDGCTSGLRSIHKVGFAQRDNAMWKHVTQSLKERGFEYHCWDRPGGYKPDGESVLHLTLSRRGQVMRFLGSIRPHRLLDKFTPDLLGAMYCEPVALVRKTPIGKHPVVALGTSTRTFLAEGLASHNCVPLAAYDAHSFTAITWGQTQKMNLPFYQRFFDEAWVAVDLDWATAAGYSPAHLNTATLNADFEALTGQPGPFPAQPTPAPQPTPSPTPSPAPARHDPADLAMAHATYLWRKAKGI